MISYSVLSSQCICLCVDQCIYPVDCGQIATRSQRRISRLDGGSDVGLGEWPWQASVQEKVNNSYQHFCGGSIIHKLWVLTSATCVFWREPESLLVKVGVVDATSWIPNVTQEFQVTHIITHREYDPSTSRNDIALLKLHTPAVYTDYVKPICLPDKMQARRDPTECYIAGFGLQNNGVYGILQQTRVLIIPNPVCNQPRVYKMAVKKRMMCAGARWSDACQGDDGIALQCYLPHDQRFYVFGVRSFGQPCSSRMKLSVYTRVQYVYYWIRHSVARFSCSAPTCHF
ncbi:KLKB1 protein, partial [Amia calva]|nr:KLKB1 protein [Amia calva]